jgi:UDP-2,3-diacylglucosamine pyrophosphatase LpxH
MTPIAATRKRNEKSRIRRVTMAQDRKLTFKRLSDLWTDTMTTTLNLADLPKLAVVSDLHLGDGGEADDLRPNVGALRAALQSYSKDGFSLVLLGDIEELWQFDLDKVAGRYEDSVYKDLQSFGRDRVIRIFGNHDVEWCCPPDPATGKEVGRGFPEAVKLATPDGEKILLVHGHQGSVDSDRNSWFSRFVVRGLFKPIEPVARFFGLYRHPSATKSMVMEDYESVMYEWAKENKVLLICGHSHRAIFGSRSYSQILRKELDGLKKQQEKTGKAAEVMRFNDEIENRRLALEDERNKGRDIGPLDKEADLTPCYFNDGCGLYTDGITALEIEDDAIRLVRWSRVGLNPREVLQEDSLKRLLLKI